MKLTVTQLRRIIKEALPKLPAQYGEPHHTEDTMVGAEERLRRKVSRHKAGINAWTNPSLKQDYGQSAFDSADALYTSFVTFARARDKVLTAEQVLEDDKRDEIRADIERIVNEFISKNKLK